MCKKFFSVTDLVKTYFQIPVEVADVPKQAIITSMRLFHFTRMIFGLCIAAQTFQRFMQEDLKGLESCYVYIDGILIASVT